MPEDRFDVVVVGAGPAGLAAAVSAAEVGRSVGLVDAETSRGGQIWRRGQGARHRAAQTWIERAQLAGVHWLPGTTVIDAVPAERDGADHILVTVSSEGARHIMPAGAPAGARHIMEGGERSTVSSEKARAGGARHIMRWGARHIMAARVVVATGARELSLPFPGATSSLVTGAGGLQALMKLGLDVAGQRVLFAGSGPLQLAVASLARQRGATVVGIAEQASLSSVAPLGASLWSSPGKLAQLAALEASLAGVRRWYGRWPRQVVEGDEGIRVELTDGRRSTWVEADRLASGFGLTPETDLGRLLGCQVDDAGRLVVDDRQATDVPGVFAAGEPTGIGGVDKALAEGEVAGLAAAGSRVPGSKSRARDRWRRFARRLDRAFALRAELVERVDREAILCRCEDVPVGAVLARSSFREAKLVTRCGMGACQGRTCGAIVREIRGWSDRSVRPPLEPVSVGTLVEAWSTFGQGD